MEKPIVVLGEKTKNDVAKGCWIIEMNGPADLDSTAFG